MKRTQSETISRELADLCARYGIAPGGEQSLSRLLWLMVTDPLAPTTLRDPRHVLDDHIADSLVALQLKCVRSARAIADLGAGAGFPGFPLAIALPAGEVTLVESNARKCAFLARARDACAIGNTRIAPARAESWTDGIASLDLAVARALAPLAVVAEYAAPLLRVGGALVVWRGRRDPADEGSGARAAVELGLEPLETIRVEPYAGALHRHLLPMIKVAPTPERFPRRPGVAHKRPLGARRGETGPGASDRARR